MYRHLIAFVLPFLLVNSLVPSRLPWTGQAFESDHTLLLNTTEETIETVEILRDAWSIPHVFANTSEGAFFGLGYVTAEDRLFQMEYSRRVIQGRISEIIGDAGLESDKLWRTLGWYRTAREVEKKIDSETGKLLQVYSQGVNKYLQDNNGSLLYLFGVYGIQPEPWTVADCIACWYRLSKFSGTFDTTEVTYLYEFEKLLQQVGWNEAVAQMSKPPIIDESGAIVQQEDMDPQLIAEIEQYARDHGYMTNSTGFYTSDLEVPKMSHAWVVSDDKSTTGTAILHSDPQITIFAPSLWYEFRICGGDFDARGIGVAGAPGMLIGWNGNISWGATASGADEYDLFKLQLNPSNTSQYYYDGAYRDMEICPEQLISRDGNNVTVIFRKSVWGPVVTPLLSDAKPGDEFALKHVEVSDSTKCSLQATVAMMKARNWTSFEEALENYTIPVLHLIYGDSEGNIGYSFAANVPLRSARSPLGGRIAQYGNSSDFDWQEMIPKRYLPHMFNPFAGAISTANNMPVGAWYPLPLGVGTGGTGDTMRSWRLRETLTQQQTFSQEDMLAVHMDIVNPATREMVNLGRHIVYDLGQNLSQESMNTLQALSSWNGEYNTSLPVYPLIQNFYLYFRRSATPLALTYGGGEAGLCYFLKTMKQEVEQNSSFVPTLDEKNYVDLSLRNTWITTVNMYGTNSSEWLQRFDKTILIAYENNFENFGSLDQSKDLASPELQCVFTSTILSQSGNSYSQDVRFDNVDLSLSVMPPGLSENPSSPFFVDQISIWKEGELHEAPLSRERIENMTTSYLRLTYGPDVKVVNLTTSKTVIGQGSTGTVNVDFENQGSKVEAFNVTVWANSTVINREQIVSASSDFAMSFRWNTTGFAYGNYVLTAYAEPLPDETDSSNNNYTCTIPVHVGVLGDVSGSTQGIYDGVVNMSDVAYTVALFNTKSDSANWDPDADVNDDGVCNMRDIAICVAYFNQHE